MFERPQTGERAVLVRLGLGKPLRSEDLDEFKQLARSAGATPVATVTGRRHRPDPRYFVRGKADEINTIAQAQGATSYYITRCRPAKNAISKLTGRRVLDRSGLILDIFAQRARTFQASCRLSSRSSSIHRRSWCGVDAFGTPEGQIGLRGPGETQLETDAGSSRRAFGP
jgi:GTP-binding protein HflX